jgi:hypothetical protein
LEIGQSETELEASRHLEHFGKVLCGAKGFKFVDEEEEWRTVILGYKGSLPREGGVLDLGDEERPI